MVYASYRVFSLSPIVRHFPVLSVAPQPPGKEELIGDNMHEGCQGDKENLVFSSSRSRADTRLAGFWVENRLFSPMTVVRNVWSREEGSRRRRRGRK